jgi:hypothetical protein
MAAQACAALGQTLFGHSRMFGHAIAEKGKQLKVTQDTHCIDDLTSSTTTCRCHGHPCIHAYMHPLTPTLGAS